MNTAKTRFITLLVSFMLMAVAVFGQTNIVPWNDDFERYTNGTPLVGGLFSTNNGVTFETNGWYASTTQVMAQTAVSYLGAKSAIIPVDAYLPNRITGAAASNVWMQFYVNVQRYDGEYYPDVDTNLASFFFVNSNGYFVVPDGPVVPETNWFVLSTTASGDPATPVGADWVRVDIFHNYTNCTWSLFASAVQMAENIGFVNTNLNALQEFSFSNPVAILALYVHTAFALSSDREKNSISLQF